MTTRALLLIALLASACRATDSYEQSIRDWQEKRETSLSSETGYLALAGLHWLEPGATTFGSGGLNDWQWSFGPTRAGVFHLRGSEVTLVVESGVTMTVDDEPVTSLRLEPDSPGPATRVTVGEATFWLIDREGKLGIRLRHAANEIRESYTFTERYAIDAGWRFPARFERFDEPKPIAVPSVLGTPFHLLSPGKVVFEIEGRRHELTVDAEESWRLFVVFGDETNGEETYGGGRFLSVDLPDEEGNTTVDFNKAYNPPCAYSPYTTCTLPLPENRLPLRVEAGELVYAAGH